MASLEAWRLLLPYCNYATKLAVRGASSALRACADEALSAGRLWVTVSDSDGDDLVVRGEEGVLPASYPDCHLPIAGAELLLPLGADVSALLPRFKQRTRIVANHYHDPPSPPASSGAGEGYDLRGRRAIGVTLDPFCDCAHRLQHAARDVAVSVLAPCMPAQDSPECGVAAGILTGSVRRLRVEVEGDPPDLVFASMAMFTRDVEVHPELQVEVVFQAWAPRQARRSTREMWAGYLGIEEGRVRVRCEEEGGERVGEKRGREETEEEVRKRRG